MKLLNGIPDKTKDTKLEKKLVKIANEYIVGCADRRTLKAMNSDSLDFIDVAIWELEKALKAAYELGKNDK